ncbi:MAG TPA: hypothetical protein VLM81_02145 [Peptostreptococcaceae bacterium]|nr:hypothetical protein [Peptostreptococcaceae bacterium]
MAKENSKLEGKYEELEEQVEVLKQELDGLTSTVESKEVDNTQDKANNEETISLPIYTKEPGSDEIQEGTKTTMRSDIKVEEKLQLLADHVSKQAFNGLTIKVESVEDGHAVIKLIETTDVYDESWVKQYFENEVKSEKANTCLSETFLQKNYEGEWIKSIEFVYEGDPGWKNGYIQNLENSYDR